MKQLKSSLLVVATLALLSACSADEEKKKLGAYARNKIVNMLENMVKEKR